MPALTTSLQRYYRRKAKWFFLGWCGHLPTFSATLARTRRRYPASAAGDEFEAWARVMFRREVEEREVLPVGGECRPRGTPGHARTFSGNPSPPTAILPHQGGQQYSDPLTPYQGTRLKSYTRNTMNHNDLRKQVNR